MHDITNLKTSEPLISIITPVLNSGAVIKNCITSVAAQTFSNFEHLIIDGGSNNETLDIIESASSKYAHIRWVSEQDNGIYDAMNKGISLSAGKWFYFIGADDELHDSRVLEEIFTSPWIEEVNLVFGDLVYGKHVHISFEDFNIFSLKHNMLAHQALFVTRQLMTRVGNFSTKYKIAADYLFVIQCFADQATVMRYVRRPVAMFGCHGVSNKRTDRLFFKDLPTLLYQELDIQVSSLDRIRYYYQSIKPTWFQPSVWIYRIIVFFNPAARIKWY